MSREITYHNGKIGAIVKYLMGMIKKDPSLVDDFEKVRTYLYLAIPELCDRSKCVNCGSSMEQYTYTFDHHDAELLISIGKDVISCIKDKGRSFTDANQVKVRALPIKDTLMAHTVVLSKLGLIAPLRLSGTSRIIKGFWVITRNGWKALRGEQFYSKIRIFRDSVDSKFEDVTTIKETIYSYEISESRRSPMPNVLSEYDTSDWSNVE